MASCGYKDNTQKTENVVLAVIMNGYCLDPSEEKENKGKEVELQKRPHTGQKKSGIGERC